MQKLTCIAAACALLAGCAGPASLSTAQVRSEQQRQNAEKLMAREPDRSAVSYSDRSWIPLRKVQRPARDAAKEQTDSIQVEINQQFANLNDVVGTIATMTGLPVTVAEEVFAQGGGGKGSGAPSIPLGPILPPQPMLGPSGGGVGGASAPGRSTAPSGPVTPASAYSANYSGSLTGFVNQVCAYYGLYWKASEAGVRLFLVDSRTFRLAALPGETRFSGSADSGANTGGGSGGTSSQQGATASSSGISYSGLNVWTSVESSVKQMLGSNGRVVASPATGTITVTDTPPVLERVAEFLDDQNKALNRQVSVNVRVLSIELNDSEAYGIQWDAVYANLSARSPGAFALKTVAASAQGVGNIVLGAPPTSQSPWAGTQAVISALSTQGRVTELTSATVVTLNNQAVPVNVGRKVSYLASSSTSQMPSAGSTTSLTPGQVSTGFAMQLVPHILDGKEMLLQYSLDLSSLLQMKSITSGGTTIETPDISTSSFVQRVRLQSNETLVVAGFDQDNLSAVADGVGAAQNTLMGRRNGSSKRSMVVILIQPTLSL